MRKSFNFPQATSPTKDTSKYDILDDTTQPAVPLCDQSTLPIHPEKEIPVEEITPLTTKHVCELHNTSNTTNAPTNEAILQRTIKTKRSDGRVDVTKTTVREEEYKTPFNTSRSSTIRSVNTEHYTEEPSYGLIPKFLECTRKRKNSVIVDTPCETCM